MSRSIVSVPLTSVLGALLALAGAAAPAVAQQQELRVTATAGMPVGGRGSGQITRSSLDRYAEILGLDESQKELAQALFDGYSTAYQDAAKDRQEAMRAVREAAQDDWEVFREKMPEITRTFSEKSTALEKQFFADLRAVLTPAQESAFAKVERHRRRETGLRGGGFGGGPAIVDLTEVARGMSLAGPEVSEALEQYESQVDRVLQDRQAAMAQLAPAGGPMEMRFDPGQMQELMAKSREYAAALRELNQSYSRRLESLLPEDRRPEFAQEMKRRTFPQVYRESHAAQSLGAAERFADLTSEQRQALADLRASYDRELPGINERLANAIAEAEEDQNSGQVALADGAVMQMRFGDEPEALREARRAKRELDERVREKLNSVLTKEQQERLPRREEGGEGGPGFMGQAIMIEERR